MNELTRNESKSRADLDSGFDDFFLKKDATVQEDDIELPKIELVAPIGVEESDENE